MTPEKCIDILMDLPLVKYGQLGIILTGALIFITAILVYRIRTQDKRYKP